MKYVFRTDEDAKRFLLDVFSKSKILDFNYKGNCVEFINEVPEYVKEKVKQYGGKKEKCC